MKRLFVLLGALACGLALAATPNGLTNRNVARIASAERGGGAASGGASLLVNENFEGTGTPTGWTVLGGTPDFDNTSSPLAGAQDYMPGLGADVSTIPWTATGELWMSFEFSHAAGLAGPSAAVFLTQNTDTTGAYVGITFSGAGTPTIQLNQNGSTVGSATVDALSQSTHYYFRFHVKKGSGADGSYDVEFSTTSSFTGSGNKFAGYASGVITTDFRTCEIYHSMAWSGSFQIDNVKISSTGWPP